MLDRLTGKETIGTGDKTQTQRTKLAYYKVVNECKCRVWWSPTTLHSPAVGEFLHPPNLLGAPFRWDPTTLHRYSGPISKSPVH